MVSARYHSLMWHCHKKTWQQDPRAKLRCRQGSPQGGSCVRARSGQIPVPALRVAAQYRVEVGRVDVGLQHESPQMAQVHWTWSDAVFPLMWWRWMGAAAVAAAEGSTVERVQSLTDAALYCAREQKCGTPSWSLNAYYAAAAAAVIDMSPSFDSCYHCR